MSFVGKWFGFGRNDKYDGGLRAYEQGRLAEAVGLFEECLEDRPDPETRHLARAHLASAQAVLGRQAIDECRYKDAVIHLRRAIDIEPHYADLRLSLAIALRGVGDVNGEAEQLAAALAINPEYPMALIHQGALWYGEGRRAEALARLALAADLDPRLDGAHYRAGVELDASGDFEAAQRHFAAIEVAEKEDANALAARGDLLASDERWQEAEEQYRRALTLAPRYADIRVKRGQALLELSDVESAIGEFREATTINPKYATAHALLGVAFKRLRRNGEAKAAFERALACDPHEPIAQREMDHLLL